MKRPKITKTWLCYPIFKKNLPTTPEASAAILKATMESMQKDLPILNEAVSRPDTIFPRAWENGFNILVPELSELKRFSQVASLHCIYHIVRGEQEIAFEYAKLGFRLIQITNSDILISRLVQIAQTIFALEALNAAQTYHAWTDAQWQELESILDTYDFLPLLPASIRCDRAIAFDTMEPMISKSGLESIKAWEDFLDPEQKSQQKNMPECSTSLLCQVSIVNESFDCCKNNSKCKTKTRDSINIVPST